MRQQAHAWKGVVRHELQDLLDAEEYVRVRHRFQGAPLLEQGHRLSNMLTQQQQNKTEKETNAQKQQTHKQKHQTQKTTNTHATDNTQTLKLQTKNTRKLKHNTKTKHTKPKNKQNQQTTQTEG